MRFTAWLTNIETADGVASVAVEDNRTCERYAEGELGEHEADGCNGPQGPHVESVPQAGATRWPGPVFGNVP
jgi:hypothetical protein